MACRRRSVSATRPPDDAWGSSDSEDEAPFSSVSALIALFNCTVKQTANCRTRIRLIFPPPITFKTLPYPLIRVCSIHNPHLRRRLSLILFSRPASIPLVKVRFVVCSPCSLHSRQELTPPAPHTNARFGPVAASPLWSQVAAQPTHINSVAPILIFPQGNCAKLPWLWPTHIDE